MVTIKKKKGEKKEKQKNWKKRKKKKKKENVDDKQRSETETAPFISQLVDMTPILPAINLA